MHEEASWAETAFLGSAEPPDRYSLSRLSMRTAHQCDMQVGMFHRPERPDELERAPADINR